MNDRLFESFCVMMDNLPVKAVMRAAMVQCHMIEDDLAKGRIPPSSTITSLLSFCVFLKSAANGSLVFFPELPIEHWAFYGKMVRKLVAAGELELKVQDQFDTAFSKSWLRLAASRA
jgi:phage pi2 protein 07